MKRHPENADADGNRLDRPGALPTPPLDPGLEALLDQALGPEATPGGIPADLSARIFARTEARLARPGHGVLARIGSGWLSVAVAATVVLGLSLGLFLTRDTTAARQARTLAAVSRELDALNRYVAHEGSDDDMALLATRIDLARTRTDWDIDDLTASGQPDWELGNDGPSDTF